MMTTKLVLNGVEIGTIGEPDDPRPPRVDAIIDAPNGDVLTITRVMKDNDKGVIAIVERFEF